MIDFTGIKDALGREVDDRPYQPERLTPQSLLAEQSTLGAILLEVTAADEALQIVERDDFYRSNHRTILDAVIELRTERVPVDIVTVCERLRIKGELEEAGGIPYIGVLMEACPSSANVTAYAGAVRDASIRRQLISAAQIAADAVYADDGTALAAALTKLHAAQDRSATTNDRFKLHTWGDLKRRPKPRQMVEGLLPERGLSVMFGAGATYKSFMALDLALHLATGRDWHGRQVLAGDVVYAAGEGVEGLCARLDAWCNRYQVDALPHFHAMTEVPRLCDEADVGRLVARLRSLPDKPRFIIIDTLAWAMEGADENNTGDMTRAVSAAKRLRDELGAAVMIVHHTNKVGELRGNLALRNNVDTMIEVRADDRRISLICNKQKDQEPFQPLTFLGGVVEIDDGSSLVFEPTASAPVGKKLPEKQQLALNILKNQHPEGASTELWQFGWTGLGEKERTFRYVREKLVSMGLVRMDGEIFIAADSI